MTDNFEKHYPKVSIIMSCYNGSRWLSEAIESVLNQSYRNFELILINDGSKDNTWSIIESYELKDSRIFAINKQNSGLADSLNFGISKASGKWVARIDQDDICDPNRIEYQIKYLIDNPSVILLGSGFIEVDENKKVIKKHKYPSCHYLLKNNLEKSKKFFPHSSACFRLDIFRQIGGYNTRIKRAEDRDLWLKFSTLGHISCVSKYLVTIRKHSDQMSLLNNGRNQVCDALSTEICHWLRKSNFKDPSTDENIEQWNNFINWVDNCVTSTNTFDKKILWHSARNNFINSKNKIFGLFLFIRTLYNKGYTIELIWEKLFGTNLSKKLSIEWMSNNIDNN